MALKFQPPNIQIPDKYQALNETLGNTVSSLPALWQQAKLDKQKRETESKRMRQEEAFNLIKQQVDLLGLSRGQAVLDPMTGNPTVIPGVSGYSIDFDAEGLPKLIKGPGASSGVSRVQQTKDPTQTADAQRRKSLVDGANMGIDSAYSSINENTINALKGVKLTGGFSLEAAPKEVKDLYTNLSIALENITYLKTGAAANPGELKNKVLQFMAKLNDSPEDFKGRLDILKRDVGVFAPGGASQKTSDNDPLGIR